MKAIATAILLLALIPAAAMAKTGLVIDSTPDGLPAGYQWVPEIQYIRADAPADPRAAHVAVRITSADNGRSLTFPANRIGVGVWQARVIFPSPGRWEYAVEGFGGRVAPQFWDPVTIAPKMRTATPVVRRDAFPLGWVIGGALLASLVGVLLLIRARRSRPGD
jgi:hypothetical protein